MSTGLRTFGLAALAMLAFAGNSLLNRAALAGRLIDPAVFTAIRLCSGAAMLALIMAMNGGGAIWPERGRWGVALGGAAALIAYAAAFSFAYARLDAVSGALILFACVQLTMQGVSLARGERPGGAQVAGLILAMGGLAWLLVPGASPPPLASAVLMAAAGASWGIYSLIGRGSSAPVLNTARAFILSVPVAILLGLFASPALPTAAGVGLAVASGAITSALGYVIWYAVLPRLSVIAAGAWQLIVPSLAAIGGVLLLGEPLPMRLVGATVAIMAGIALTLVPRRSA